MFFEKMQTRKNDGFTLVELIVVIAILAILAGIGVPAYSGYVEKANIAADQTLVGEVANALQLYYYDNYESAPSGYVTLSTTSAPSLSGIPSDAMTAVFGEEWAALRLKHDGHNAEYQASSFSGNETVVLDQVNTLTNAMASAIKDRPDIVGESFGNYLAGKDLADASNEEKANAAVLYIAQKTSQASKDAYLETVADYSNVGLSGLMTAAGETFPGVSGVAAMYAIAEGFFQYEKQENGSSAGLDTLHAAFDNQTVTSTDDAKTILLGAIQTAMGTADQELAAAYFAGGSDSQAVKDTKAYFDIMNTVTSAENQVIDEIKKGNGLNNDTVTGLLSNYAGGGVVITLSADGSVFNPLLP